VTRARAGEGPSLIEARTIRFMGHFEGDPQGYRSRDEVEAGRQRDPIARLRAHLEGAKLLDAASAARVAAAVEAEVQDAVDFADSSPLPSPEDALQDLFVHYPWTD
jgi:TPP-dependent pyruvate/acetoin dehydrogenase alpha subunit